MILGSSITGIVAPLGPRKKRERPFQSPYRVRQKAFALNKVKARRRLHKEFFRWLAQNRHRFALKLQIEQRFDEWIELTFDGINPVIKACLMAHNQELEVRAEYEGQIWDCVGSFWAWPKPVVGGYIDHSLLEEYRQLLPNRQRIWELGIFEQFVEWVNDTLVNADWIELQGEGDAWSLAKLLTDEELAHIEAERTKSGSREDSKTRRIILPCRTNPPISTAMD